MNRRRKVGAVAGAVVAGLGISALLIRQERQSGAPSELAFLARNGAARFGMSTPAADQLPDTREQAAVQAGHLLLSVVAGLAYAAATDEDAGVVPSGVSFGLAFYAAAHWLAGPALGLKRPEWEADLPIIGMHTINHVLFGLTTAAGARLAVRA